MARVAPASSAEEGEKVESTGRNASAKHGSLRLGGVEEEMEGASVRARPSMVWGSIKAAEMEPNEGVPGTLMRAQLLMACEAGDLDTLSRFLNAADKASILAVRDSQTWPLLAIAASRGHEALVCALLDFGCPVDIQDEVGATPLYRAVGFRQNGCVKALLARGADCTHVNKEGNNIIHNSAYVCNDFATIEALKAGVDPTQPNGVKRISLLDMVENQPHLTLVYLDSKVQRLSNYVQHTKMLYDFTGLDYKDSLGLMDSPLEAIIARPASQFLLQHMLVKQYLQWQWRLYGRRHFTSALIQHVVFLLLVTYIAIVSQYKLQRPEGELHKYRCCEAPQDVALNVLRAAAELLLLPLCAFITWGEWQEYRKSGHTQVRVRGSGWASKLMRLVFRQDKDVHQTNAAVVAVPRYLLDVWNLADLGSQLLILSLGAIRMASMARDHPVLSPTGECYALAWLVIIVWTRLLSLAGVFRTTGPKLRVLRRMLVNVLDFSVLYLMFFFAISVALFLVLGSAQGPDGGPALQHSTLLNSFMTTFQITLAAADYTVYTTDAFAVVLYVVWTVLSALLLLSLLVAILSYDFTVGVEAAEQEWLVVLGGYLLKAQRLMGDEVVQRLKAEDLERCHAMGGFCTPLSEFKTNLPTLNRAIPAKLFVIWEDTTAWQPAFRKLMESAFSYDDDDFVRAQVEADDRQQQANVGGAAPERRFV